MLHFSFTFIISSRFKHAVYDLHAIINDKKVQQREKKIARGIQVVD